MLAQHASPSPGAGYILAPPPIHLWSDDSDLSPSVQRLITTISYTTFSARLIRTTPDDDFSWAFQSPFLSILYRLSRCQPPQGRRTGVVRPRPVLARSRCRGCCRDRDACIWSGPAAWQMPLTDNCVLCMYLDGLVNKVIWLIYVCTTCWQFGCNGVLCACVLDSGWEMTLVQFGRHS